MIAVLLLAHGIDLAICWSLPVLFFEKKDGKLNVRWFATAMPFAVAPLLFALGLFDVVPLFDWVPIESRYVGIALAIASGALAVWAWRTHRVRLSLWHMENDAPKSIVTTGPYALIRHPFYTAFQLAIYGALASAPQVGLVITALYATAILTWTAAREEQRLSASTFGEEYRAYMARTGRFLPRLMRRSHDAAASDRRSA